MRATTILRALLCAQGEESYERWMYARSTASERVTQGQRVERRERTAEACRLRLQRICAEYDAAKGARATRGRTDE